MDVFILVILLCFSGLFASAEVAFFSLNPSQLRKLSLNQKKRTNNIILNLLSNPKKLIATLLISNNLVNIAIIILSAVFTSQWFSFENNPILAFIIQIVVVTFLIVLFGEVMPKVYAAHNNMRLAQLMSYPLYAIQKILSPISVPLAASTAFLEKLFKKKTYNVTMDELTHAIDITDDADSPPEEKRILKGIVQFGNIDVKQIMKARPDIVALDMQWNYGMVLSKIEEAGYSRLPVFEKSLDRIKGVLHIKDLMPHLDKSSDFKWGEIIRPTYFVPESKKINDLLQQFQQRKIHMAIVIDEFGGTSGIVTLEDVLEEIVGELKDEFDDEEPVYTKIDDATYVFEAKTLLNDLCRIMEIDRSEFTSVSGDIDTLAGLLMELNGTIPSKNDVIRFKMLRFTIESADKRRIKRVKVSIEKQHEINE